MMESFKSLRRTQTVLVSTFMKAPRQTTNCTSSISNLFFHLVPSLRQFFSLKSLRQWISGTTVWVTSVRQLPETCSNPSRASYSFHPGDKLSKCEPCIIGKHTRAPHPSSLTSKSTQLLELVHCDLCGPFPVLTPHGKQYLIAFLEDSGDILKVYCLARKDQAAESFQIMRANWEKKTGRKILRFRIDSAGELASSEFIVVLESMGIERDVVPRYEHWKNGKMERVFRTLQG
jgi:hypothetical protein